MKVIGFLLNNIGFICLLLCIVLLGAQWVLDSNADVVIVAGQEFGINAVRDFFNPVFNSENEIVRLVVENLVPCTIGSFVVMLLGGVLRKAAK